MRRTQDEIVAQINEVRDNDFFGAETQELLSALDFDHAKQFLKEDAKAEDWETYPLDEIELRKAAHDYLEFAVGKATGHRGLSAARSIGHYRGWVWLLEPELFEGFDKVPYAPYGVPQLHSAAVILDLVSEFDRLAAETPELLNMVDGRPCEPGCVEGCLS
jgi:hypothetical protein